MAGLDFATLDYRQAHEACYRTPAGTRITPQGLLDLACLASARYEELRVRYPAGTILDERNLMRTVAEHAIEVAAWMEARGVQAAIFAGPFGPAQPRKGDHVTIRCGAAVYSTHPRLKVTTLRRSTLVKVHLSNPGYVHAAARADRNEERVMQPQVHWTGAGGYWRWTDASNLVLPAS